MPYRTAIRCCVCACALGLVEGARAAPPTLSAAEQSEELAAISQKVFQGQTMPPDMVAMCTQQLRRSNGKKKPSYNAWVDMDAICLTPQTVHEPRDTSYLKEKQRLDPDIAANVKATDVVMSHITFVAKTSNGDFLGYWQWPKRIPLGRARIVRYDTEGQFSLQSGRTITEALLLEYVDPDDEHAAAEYRRLRDSLEHLGAGPIAHSYDALDKQALPIARTRPEVVHDQLYKQYRAQMK